MANLRQWLNEENFNWAEGRIIYHPTASSNDDFPSPGWSCLKGQPILLPHDSAILDKEFDAGYGGPQCPRIVADDSLKIYFPSQYDGATGLESIYKDVSRYMEGDIQTPYPGG
jgi:hypothetical protein